jgi:very-short-patch-repair endonuclease
MDRELFNQLGNKKFRQKNRNNMPEAEKKLWFKIRKKQLGVRFRRQHGIGPFIVDFYAPSLKLVIEIDGDTHFEPGAERQDQKRESFLTRHNLTILRFTNNDVYNNLDGVLEKIHDTISQLSETKYK